MKHIFTIAFFLFSLSLFSQNISVASFEVRPNDMDARVNHPVKDQNGDVCALLKIETTETGFVFEGGSLGIVKTERKTGEYWVYIPWGAKQITIKHDQLGILRDYMYPESINKATVYVMKLTTGKVTVVVEEAEIKTQWLIIKSDPEGANVFIDDQLVGTTPFQRKYEEKDYNYRIEKSRYHTQAGVLSLFGDKKSLDLKLKPKFGDIMITSSPESGMQIYIDDENTGKTTPATLKEVSSGEHRVKLQSQWYQPKTQVLTVADEQTTNIDFTLEPAFAEITIDAKPNADIYIDGTKKGNGNWSGRLLNGVYTIKIEKDKYYSQEKQLKVVAGQDESLNFDLTGKKGNLDIMTNPLEANVYLDNTLKGKSPITINDLLVGNYDIRLEKEGYGTIKKTVTIKEKEDIIINETLPAGKEITISSNPSGVELEINGKYVGKTPYTTTLSFTQHQLKLTNNTKVINENITVTQTGKASWSFDVNEKFGTFTDSRDGKTYKTVKIGNQTWMAENLNYRTSSGSWCYDDNNSNCDKYGRLYNWEAAKHACPNGWHLPTKSEFEILLSNYGGEGKSSYKALIPTGSSDFSALFGGWRNDDGNYNFVGGNGYFWSSSLKGSDEAWYLYIYSRFKVAYMYY